MYDFMNVLCVQNFCSKYIGSKFNIHSVRQLSPLPQQTSNQRLVRLVIIGEKKNMQADEQMFGH